MFLTVGTQLPFDRLVRAVDAWCAANPGQSVFGQIADPGPDGYLPQHFEWQPFVEPVEFDRRFEEAELVIAHAGMGSIITAMSHGKPILIMPRRADLREQRNDHQLATAAQFAGRTGVHVAADEAALAIELDSLQSQTRSDAAPGISPFASDTLIQAIRGFIHRS